MKTKICLSAPILLKIIMCSRMKFFLAFFLLSFNLATVNAGDIDDSDSDGYSLPSVPDSASIGTVELDEGDDDERMASWCELSQNSFDGLEKLIDDIALDNRLEEDVVLAEGIPPMPYYKTFFFPLFIEIPEQYRPAALVGLMEVYERQKGLFTPKACAFAEAFFNVATAVIQDMPSAFPMVFIYRAEGAPQPQMEALSPPKEQLCSEKCIFYTVEDPDFLEAFQLIKLSLATASPLGPLQTY
jgi:hypothetical protein